VLTFPSKLLKVKLLLVHLYTQYLVGIHIYTEILRKSGKTVPNLSHWF